MLSENLLDIAGNVIQESRSPLVSLEHARERLIQASQRYNQTRVICAVILKDLFEAQRQCMLALLDLVFDADWNALHVETFRHLPISTIQFIYQECCYGD